jgi:hypothetical protein
MPQVSLDLDLVSHMSLDTHPLDPALSHDLQGHKGFTFPLPSKSDVPKGPSTNASTELEI